MPPASCEEELQRVCRSDHGARVGLNYDFEIVGILTLFPYFSVDPSFVTETGTCRQSPIEIAAEKDPELSLHLLKTKLSQLISQEGETVKAKEDFARFLKTVSPTEVRMVYESFATVGEIRVWWRADFQSGSRVLKKVF